jgi:hypothetical protein
MHSGSIDHRTGGSYEIGLLDEEAILVGWQAVRAGCNDATCEQENRKKNDVGLLHFLIL